MSHMVHLLLEPSWVFFAYSYHIDFWTKWSTFIKRYTQIEFFLNKNVCMLIYISMKAFLEGPLDNKSALL